MAEKSTNPFPGVNPFIEAEGFWEDFHRRFVNYLCEAMLMKLPGRYDARIDERVDLLDPDTGKSIRMPDVAVIESPIVFRRERIEYEEGDLLVEEEIDLLEMDQLPVEEVREVWLEIRDLKDESLVTSIEVLSPTNKSPGGYEHFKYKRIQLLEGGAHLIDIDLLLKGTRLRFVQPLPTADFYVFRSRHERRPKTEVLRWSIDKLLPKIRVPLRAPDPDILIDLQEVYTTTFDRGQYPRRLRYRNDIDHSQKEWIRKHAGPVALT